MKNIILSIVFTFFTVNSVSAAPTIESYFNYGEKEITLNVLDKVNQTFKIQSLFDVISCRGIYKNLDKEISYPFVIYKNNYVFNSTSTVASESSSVSYVCSDESGTATSSPLKLNVIGEAFDLVSFGVSVEVLDYRSLLIGNWALSNHTKDLSFKVEHFIDGKKIDSSLYLNDYLFGDSCVNKTLTVKAGDTKRGCYYNRVIDIESLNLMGKHILTEKITPININISDKETALYNNISTLEVDFSPKYYNVTQLASYNNSIINTTETGSLGRLSSFATCKKIVGNLNTKSSKVAIKNLQQFLIDGGYLTIISSPNGFFGPATIKALKAYQKDWGLKVTGLVDAKTKEKINLQCSL